MKLLAVSEHYFPRVGGTVNYVHETLSALVRRGVEVELWVPGPAPVSWLPAGMAEPQYEVRWINACYPAKGDPTRSQRYDFCHQVNRLALASAAGPERPDILHVLFGLFMMEVLDTSLLRAAGVPTLATVHNVPPMECRQIAHEAPLKTRLREELRLKGVRFKNRVRLRRHHYDQIIVPSEQVRRFLAPLVRAPVTVIGHGLTSELQAQMHLPATRRPDGPVRLLTVGGYAPHKRQHILPETAAQLRNSGFDFVWQVAGPAGRVRTYFEGIGAEIRTRGLQDCLILRESVPFSDLGRLYDRANLYVQPSIEEGFCLTALDAAAVGLPVIASRAGALPALVEASGGVLVQSAPKQLASAVVQFVSRDGWQNPAEQARRVKKQFSWSLAAAQLKKQYEELKA